MIWYDDLWVTENIEKKADKIKWKINHNAGQVDIYVLALASNPSNLIDIIPAQELMQKGYPKSNLYIIGLAKGYDYALDLVTYLVDLMYKSQGNFDIRSFLNINYNR